MQLAFDFIRPIVQPADVPTPDFTVYDKYIVAFSGGKDSIACFLHLLEMGVDRSKIELWHHLVDGQDETFMDWECTTDYCRKFAKAFGVPIYFSWKEGGFKGEMLRTDSLTAATSFEDEHYNVVTVGGKLGKKSTRLKFPQVSADLAVRWCSAYLKVDIFKTAIANQIRFRGLRTLVISGERGEESSARGKYAKHGADETDLRDGQRYQRYIDRSRPIRDWLEPQVWAIIERWKIRMHPAYYLGWARLSCKLCIFGSANQFASANHISPKQTSEVIKYEKQFGCTIKRSESVEQLIAKGKVYPSARNKELATIATSETYTLDIFTDNWELPAGAYGESCGPI